MEIGSELLALLEFFGWPVTRLVSSPDQSVLQQLTRSINDSHHEVLTWKPDIFDKLNGMKQKYGLLCGTRGNCGPLAGVEVAEANDARNANKCHSETAQAINHMFQMAIRPNMRVIEDLAPLWMWRSQRLQSKWSSSDQLTFPLSLQRKLALFSNISLPFIHIGVLPSISRRRTRPFKQIPCLDF